MLAAETDDRPSLEQVLTLARTEDNQLVTILALDALARLSAQDGALEHAAELVMQADALHPAVAHLLHDADRPDRIGVRAVSG